MRWIIYYGNGEVYRDCDGPPEMAPARNIQVIAVEDEITGRSFVRSNDYYWWTGNTWDGGDVFGLFDRLIEPGWQRVLFGRTISTPEYQAVLRQAQADDYLPRKSARHEWERKT